MTTTLATPDSITHMIAFGLGHLQEFSYSEGGGRLTPGTSGHTDCSGYNRYLFEKFCHVIIGGYTGDQCRYGQDLNLSRGNIRACTGLRPGDALFWRWENRALGSDPWDHTSLYIGGGKTLNHGGPGRGPIVELVAHNVDNAVAVMARRFVPPVVITVKTPAVAKDAPWPFPASDTIDQLGFIGNPSDHVHGGYVTDSAAVKAAILTVKKHLHALGFTHSDPASDQWGDGTDSDVLAWRAKYDPTARGIKTLGRGGYTKLTGVK